MAVLDIALMGNPILRQKAQPVPTDDIKSKQFQQFLDDMIETACQKPEAGYLTAGLAAPQVNKSTRVFLIMKPGATSANPGFNVYINPEIEITTNELVTGFESCLSTPSIGGEVKRYSEIELKYQDRKEISHKEIFSGEFAVYIQHEYDHLEGILWIDKVTDTKTITYC
ncbi:peptide deformylase [Candidatus Dojkabacteria bacterium]|nr:peptide deformylase [Candidatus Dojkabacteria bacterium]